MANIFFPTFFFFFFSAPKVKFRREGGDDDDDDDDDDECDVCQPNQTMEKHSRGDAPGARAGRNNGRFPDGLGGGNSNKIETGHRIIKLAMYVMYSKRSHQLGKNTANKVWSSYVRMIHMYLYIHTVQT